MNQQDEVANIDNLKFQRPKFSAVTLSRPEIINVHAKSSLTNEIYSALGAPQSQGTPIDGPFNLTLSRKMSLDASPKKRSLQNIHQSSLDQQSSSSFKKKNIRGKKTLENHSLEATLDRVNYFNTNKNFRDCQMCKVSEKGSTVGSCNKKDEHLIETKINERQA